jgi:hypothetical protein
MPRSSRWPGVLLRPLVNRDEQRLVYIRQSQSGIGSENAEFSVPELKVRATTPCEWSARAELLLMYDAQSVS